MSRVVIQVRGWSRGRKESHLLRETTLNLKPEIRAGKGLGMRMQITKDSAHGPS